MISRKYSCPRVACCKVPHSRIDPDGQFLGRSGIRLSQRPDSPVGNLLPPCPGSPFSPRDGGTSENGKHQASLCSLTILRLTGQRPSASSAGASSTFTGRLGCELLLLIRGRILVEAFVRSRIARGRLAPSSCPVRSKQPRVCQEVRLVERVELDLMALCDLSANILSAALATRTISFKVVNFPKRLPIEG